MPPKNPVEFGPTQRIQREYERGLREIAGRVLIAKRPEQSFSDWLRSLAARSQEPFIQEASAKLAERMILTSRRTNWRTWREAAARTTRSQQLYQMLEAEMQGATGARVQTLIRENSKLISSLPLESASILVDEITQAQQSGARARTIAKMASKRFPELVRSRVHLISRTETAKASSALTQARCDSLNIQWFMWESSTDKRTRKSHKNLHNVLCNWNDLPSPEKLVGEKDYGKYAPGSTFNCRCVVIPILTLDDITFPARVYWNGAITTMTKQKFKSIAVGLEERAAA